MRSTRCVRAFNWDVLYGAVIKVPVCSGETVVFWAEESVEIEPKCMNRPVRTTITANKTRPKVAKIPALPFRDCAPRGAGFCFISSVISLRDDRIIGERSASLGIKLPGCYLSWYNYTRTSISVATG